MVSRGARSALWCIAKCCFSNKQIRAIGYVFDHGESVGGGVSIGAATRSTAAPLWRHLVFRNPSFASLRSEYRKLREPFWMLPGKRCS
jgi:hypothetical protein